jgi:hypothetical protein
MTNIETRRYEMLVRVHEFAQTYRDRSSAPNVGAEGFAAVTAAVGQLREQAVRKLQTAREGRSTKGQAHEALVAGLDAIARTARVLAEETPGLDGKFWRPKNPSDQTLLTSARAVAHDGEALRNRFVAHGMAETFVENLCNRIDVFADAIRQRDAGRSGQTAARTRIEAALTSGMAAVRKLDVIVTNQLHDDTATIAVWERSHRVERPRRARSVATVVTPPPVPPPIADPNPVGIDGGAAKAW